MLRCQSRAEYVKAVITWATGKFNPEIVKAIIDDLETQNEGLFETHGFPVYGYFNHAGILTARNASDSMLFDIFNPPPYTGFENLDQEKLRTLEPDWGVGKLPNLGEIWPRFQRLCEKYEVNVVEWDDGSTQEGEGGEFPPTLVKGLSQKHLDGIGCGHYRLRKEKTFPGVIGFTDIWPGERAFYEWAHAPLIPTICGHTANCDNIILSICECCGVIVCSECKQHHEIEGQNVEENGLDARISFCPLWGPLDFENWSDYKHRKGEYFDLDNREELFGHPACPFTDILDILCEIDYPKEERNLIRGLGFVYPPVRARTFGHPLFNNIWSTTHPLTTPNHGPGEIYSIHDEDCCGDNGRGDFFTFHKIKGL
jgi:hypothetical protein